MLNLRKLLTSHSNAITVKVLIVLGSTGAVTLIVPHMPYAHHPDPPPVEAFFDQSGSWQGLPDGQGVIEAVCIELSKHLVIGQPVRINKFANAVQTISDVIIGTRLDAARVCAKTSTPFQFGSQPGTNLFKPFESANHHLDTAPGTHPFILIVVDHNEGDDFPRTVRAIKSLLSKGAVVVIFVHDATLLNQLDSSIIHEHFKASPATDDPAAAITWGFKTAQ